MSNPIDQAKTPVLAAIGAGDYALQTIADLVSGARARAEERVGETRNRVEETRERITDLPNEIDELRTKLEPEELRKVAEAYVQAAASIYVSLAERGEVAVERLRKQPGVEQAIDRAEATRSRVDATREDAKEITDDVLGTIARQTRSIGERAARATERVTGRANEAVSEAGEDAAHEIRSVSRKAANRTSPPKGSTRDNPRKAATKKASAAKATAKADVKEAADTTAKKASSARKTTAKKTSSARKSAASTAKDNAPTASKTAADVKDIAKDAQDEATAKTS
ncbi:hypothetical protein GCM10027047_13800 [Rhodococcus aerolatus]